MESSALKALVGFALNLLGGGLIDKLPENWDWLSWSLIISGVVLLVWAAQEYLLGHLGWRIHACWRFPRVRILMPLETAALAAYKANRKLPDKHVIELLGLELTGQDMRLSFLASQIAESGTLYGVHPPSDELEIINKDQKGRIVDNGRVFVSDAGQVMFEGLMVECCHVKRLLKEWGIPEGSSK